jgi:hypothetical protein
MGMVTSKKDLSFVIKIVANGFVFISMLILTIIGFGIYSLNETTFEYNPNPLSKVDYETPIRPYALFSSGFPSLAGALCVGYFLHPVAIPIMKNNANQKNNSRDLFFAYLLVFSFSCLVGTFGYFGFSG